MPQSTGEAGTFAVGASSVGGQTPGGSQDKMAAQQWLGKSPASSTVGSEIAQAKAMSASARATSRGRMDVPVAAPRSMPRVMNLIKQEMHVGETIGGF